MDQQFVQEMSFGPINYEKMPSFGGVAAGQTASVSLPLGLTYRALYFECVALKNDAYQSVKEADWPSIIDEIRIIINGTATITITSKDLIALNKYNGFEQEDGILPLFFTLRNARTVLGEETGAYGTRGIQSFNVEVDIKSGADIKSLSLSAERSIQTNFGSHLEIKYFTKSHAVVGDVEITELPQRADQKLIAVHIPTSDVGRVVVKGDNRTFYDMSKELRKTTSKVNGRTTQANYTHIDFVPANRILDSMPLNFQDFRIIANFEATGNSRMFTVMLRGGL